MLIDKLTQWNSEGLGVVKYIEFVAYGIFSVAVLKHNDCMLVSTIIICDRACENRPCKCKLQQVIFSLISFVQKVISH